MLTWPKASMHALVRDDAVGERELAAGFEKRVRPLAFPLVKCRKRDVPHYRTSSTSGQRGRCLTDRGRWGRFAAIMAPAAQIVIDRVNHLYRPPRGRGSAGARPGFAPRSPTASSSRLLGPSGCGKSTLLYLDRRLFAGRKLAPF